MDSKDSGYVSLLLLELYTTTRHQKCRIKKFDP